MWWYLYITTRKSFVSIWKTRKGSFHWSAAFATVLVVIPTKQGCEKGNSFHTSQLWKEFPFSHLKSQIKYCSWEIFWERVWKGKDFLRKNKKVFAFHTSNNCIWKIFWEGVWKGKDFLRKKEKVFTFHTSKKCTWDIWKWSPPPTTRRRRRTLSSPWSVGFAADKTIIC